MPCTRTEIPLCSIPAVITSASKHHNPDVGARRAVPRLGEARLAPTIDMFNCPRNADHVGRRIMADNLVILEKFTAKEAIVPHRPYD